MLKKDALSPTFKLRASEFVFYSCPWRDWRKGFSRNDKIIIYYCNKYMHIYNIDICEISLALTIL